MGVICLTSFATLRISNYYERRFLNLMTLNVRIATPKIKSARASRQSSDMPTPFKNNPLIIVIKYRSGITYVMYCTSFGIFSMGKVNPERKINGMKIKNCAVIIACCCVFEMVETKRPNPNVVKINKPLKP